MQETLQRRAKAGGERGANGEWYEGGKFIATTDHAKSAPMRHEVSSEEQARRDAYRAEQQDRAGRVTAWLDGRRLRFREILQNLLSTPYGMDEAQWKFALANGHGGFLPSLGTQLYNSGSLSEKQARYVVKSVMGRCTNGNSEKWYDLLDALTEDFKG